MSTIEIRLVVMLLLVALLFGVNMPARADVSPTITVVGEGETPDDIMKVIELPDRAATAAALRAGNASDTAAAAKDKTGTGGDFGAQISQDARDRTAAEQALEARDRNDSGSPNRRGRP